VITKTGTLDGALVVEGMRVWDYDLRPRIVGKIRYREGTSLDGDGDPWYRMIDPVTGNEGSDMNPSRMWFRHPTTGQPA